MRILVVGGGGFLGSELVTALSKNKDNELFIFDSYKYGFPKKLPAKKNISPPIVGNIRNFYDISRVLIKIKPEIVIHLASFPTRPENIGELRSCAEINYVGTTNVLESCLSLEEKPRRIVFASCEAARNPQSHFGIAKQASEKLLQSICVPAGMELIVLRFAEIYGLSSSQTSGSMLNFLVDNMLVGNGIGLCGVDKVKDHVHISDAVAALVRSTEVACSDPIVADIGPGTGIAIKDLVTKVKKATGFKGSVAYIGDTKGAIRVVDSVSDPEPARKLLNFECQADLDVELAKLVRKRKRDLK